MNTGTDEARCFLGKLYSYLPIIPSSFTSTCHSVDGKKRDEPAGLCVMMAMTSLCHFCDPSKGVKVLLETAPAFTSPSPIRWHTCSATAAFPPVELPEVCLPPPHITCSPHQKTPQWCSPTCGKVCMFCVECHVVLKSHLLWLFSVVQLRSKTV